MMDIDYCGGFIGENGICRSNLALAYALGTISVIADFLVYGYGIPFLGIINRSMCFYSVREKFQILR